MVDRTSEQSPWSKEGDGFDLQKFRQGEELRRIALDGGGMGAWRWDLRDRLVWGDARFLALWGLPPSDAAHSLALFTERMSPAGAAEMRELITRAVAAREAFDGQLEVVSGSTAGRWVRWRGRADSEEPWIVHGVSFDVTERKAMVEALEAEKERFRVVVEGVPQMTWRSLDRGRWTWASPQWRAYTGQEPSQSRGLGWLDALHPDDRGRALAAWAGAGPQGHMDVEYRVRRASDGTWRWHQTRSLPVRAAPRAGQAEGHIIEWLGTTTDIEDLKRLQAEQAVLLAELQHRTRNLVAVARSIARRSIEPSPGRDVYDRRLAAIGRVQGFLARGGWAVSLEELVRAELAAAGGGSDRTTVEGPTVELPGDKAQVVTLALHELATNAAKYGAIAQDGARLAVVWRVEEEAAEDRLVLEWRESGVAMPPGPPQRQGYGSELIERALPYQLGANTELRFAASGVHCRISLPWTAIPQEAPGR